MKNLSNMLLLSSLHDLERYIYKMKKKKNNKNTFKWIFNIKAYPNQECGLK